MNKWPTYPEFAELVAARKAFMKSDGCTDVPDFNFCGCCFEHDYYYTTHVVSRSEADKRLRQCIAEKKGRWLAWMYWAGVRVVGREFYKTKYDPSVWVPEEIIQMELDP